MTFKTVNHKTTFLSYGDFEIRGFKCSITDINRTRYKVRAHWTPYYVPMQNLTDILTREGVKVISATFDKSVVKGMEEVDSLLRTITVECDTPSSIPHVVNWHFHGKTGQTLFTMTGRPPVCLKCKLAGHIRRDCTTAF